MEKMSVNPMRILGMTTMDLGVIAKFMIESQNILPESSKIKEPTEDEIESMWEMSKLMT